MKKLLIIVIITIPITFYGQCQNNDTNMYSIKFGYGPTLEYVKSDELNHEINSNNYEKKLEYIHLYKNNLFDSLYYEWQHNGNVINNINFLNLEFKEGVYYCSDTLYSGNVFFSNNEVEEKYCCEICTPLNTLIKKDFIIINGEIR
ncbi:MAG: hypothetical protein CMD28_04035 [Flavobacteriales bacterium]|nr:hypothetical protein [Flavobacteriales bacterium]|tara:strand:+ start:216 stop:653 length:438 start_codon:yes stop_codon:yes gene_type:complete